MHIKTKMMITVLFCILFINTLSNAEICRIQDQCNNSIINFKNELNCIGENSCYKSTINCNSNQTNCYIKCSGDTSCGHTIINCNNNEYECNVNCSINNINDNDYGICEYGIIS